MVFSRPETPMTATSWGAPEHWPASPFESFRPHTPDMGFREQHSRPMTPSTSTSWGAPEYWPPTPFEHTRPQTPDYAQRAHDEDHPASFNHAKPWAHVWPFSEISKEQQRALLESTTGGFRFVWPFMSKRPPRVLLESKHGSFQFVWPFIGRGPQPAVESTSKGSLKVGGSAMARELETAASLYHAKPWAHVWPFSEIRKEQQRALLENKIGSFRFVWPFMNTSPQRALLESKHGSFQFVWPFMGKDPQPAINSTSSGSLVVGQTTIAIMTELETNNKSDPFAFVWPFFQGARIRPSPQFVVIPSTYPFLQICKSPFSFPPLPSFTYRRSTHLRDSESPMLITGLCDIDVPADRSVYPHVNEVYTSKSVGELEVPKCRSVRLHNAHAYDCECYLSSRSCGERSIDPPSYLEEQVLIVWFQIPSWSSTPRRMARATVRNTGEQGLSMSKSNSPTRTSISTRLCTPSFARTPRLASWIT